MTHFYSGFLLGFSIAAPVGPIGLLCIRRSIVAGRLAGLVSGLGAATADALYGIVAALGLTAITSLLLAHRGWLQLSGGVFLVYLGIKMLCARPATEAARLDAAPNLSAMYVSTLVLTLTNPMTILSFVAIFAGAGVAATNDRSSAAWLVGGVFFGSAAWWLILSALAGWLGGRLERGGLRVVNLIAGLIVASFGVWQLVTLR